MAEEEQEYRTRSLDFCVPLRRFRVMSRIERSYENCEMYDNLQDH